jgi:tetratricopeptide (TPR) repeat protein
VRTKNLVRVSAVSLLSSYFALGPSAFGSAGADGDEFTAKLKTAIVLQDSGDYQGAEQLLAPLLKQAGALGVADPRMPVLYNNLGSLYHFQEKYVQAEWAYRKAIDICRTHCGLETGLTTRFMANLAELYLQTEQYAKAERLGLRSLATQLEESQPEDPDFVRLLRMIGDLALRLGRFEEAESAFDAALARSEIILPGGTESTQILNNLGILYYRTGRNAAALSYCSRALASAEKVFQPKDPRLAQTWLNTGALRLLLNGPVDAEPFFQKALAIGEGSLGRQDPVVGQILAAYATCLKQMDRKAEAKEYERRSKTILQSASAFRPSRYTVDAADLRVRR